LTGGVYFLSYDVNNLALYINLLGVYVKFYGIDINIMIEVVYFYDKCIRKLVVYVDILSK